MRKVLITIEDNKPHAEVECIQDGVRYPAKHLRIRELRALLDVDEEEFLKVLSPILSQTGCVRYAGYYKKGRVVQEKAVFVLPADRHDVNYCGQVFPQVGHPGLLFVFTLEPLEREKLLTHTELYALKPGDSIRKDLLLYHYPFGNVSSYVCWGDFGQVKVSEVYELRGLPYAFLQLEKNDDLFSPDRNNKGLCQRELLKYLSGRDFDESLLVPSKRFNELL